MTSKPADIFGRFVTGYGVEDVTEHQQSAAKYIIADCIAAIIGGSAEPDITSLIDQFSTSKHGESSILGTLLKTDRASASFIHGTAGTVLEMDEGHQFARGHPGMHVLPALLAYVEGRDVIGRDFLWAFILGYDVGARIGLATRMNPHMHPHGTWGGLGAAAALAAIEDLNEHDTARLLNIASSLTLATSRKTMLEGGTVRNAYTGVSNQMAHLAMTMLKAGFSGEEDGISSVFGAVISTDFDSDLAFEALGERFELNRNYFKLHACCRFNHAALDALMSLIEECPELQNPDQLCDHIKAIDVASYNLAAELDDPAPRNVLACKFSIPFAMATTLFHQSSDVMSFTEQARINPVIQALCKRVQVREDQTMTAQLPDFRPAHVAVTLTDGRVMTAEVTTNRGDWRDPYNASELKEKFISLTTRLWSFEKAENVHRMIMTIDDQPMDDVINLLVS